MPPDELRNCPFNAWVDNLLSGGEYEVLSENDTNVY